MYVFILMERFMILERILVKKRSEKIEIFVRKEIKNYLYDYVNKMVLLKNNS